MTKKIPWELWVKIQRCMIVMQPSDRSSEFDRGAKWVTQKILGNLFRELDDKGLVEHEKSRTKRGTSRKSGNDPSTNKMGRGETMARARDRKALPRKQKEKNR